MKREIGKLILGATDMLIDYIDNSEEKGLFVNVDSAKVRIAEWRKELDINK